ncbi:MAG: Trypsin [Proteobacteria bacterium]|nr:Trypsin [Pseudomonadota bacterium]
MLADKVSVLLLAIGLVVPAMPAEAVVILDSTWARDGGEPGNEAAGFDSALHLAAAPQFRAVLAMSSDGEAWGEASGTWLGNKDGHAYILSAAHIFDVPLTTDQYVVRAPDGETLGIDRVWVLPEWDGDPNIRAGYDLTILRLEDEIDGAGPQPVLYTGANEAGKLITFVGYGSRGIGSSGEGDDYYEGSDKAAAQGIVDSWEELVRPPVDGEEAGNELGVFLPKEDGSIENSLGGLSRPATPLVGLLGSGDSGGSAWMKTKAGWLLVGVNSNGTGEATYGETSWFCRVSPHRKWIASIFPGTRFATP